MASMNKNICWTQSVPPQGTVEPSAFEKTYLGWSRYWYRGRVGGKDKILTEKWKKEHQGQRRTRTAPWYRSRYYLELHGGVHARANVYFLKELKHGTEFQKGTAAHEKNCAGTGKWCEKKGSVGRNLYVMIVSQELSLPVLLGGETEELRVKDESWNCERVKRWCSFCVFLYGPHNWNLIYLSGKKNSLKSVLLVMVIAAEFPSCYLNSQDFSPYFHLLPSPSSSSLVGRVNEWLNGLWLLAKPNWTNPQTMILKRQLTSDCQNHVGIWTITKSVIFKKKEIWKDISANSSLIDVCNASCYCKRSSWAVYLAV